MDSHVADEACGAQEPRLGVRARFGMIVRCSSDSLPAMVRRPAVSI